MRKSILVTGGSGFIGSAITIYLVKKGYNVTVFDNNSRGKLARLKSVEHNGSSIYSLYKKYCK